MKKTRLDPPALGILALGWVLITGLFLVAGSLISDAVYEPGRQTFLGPLSFAVGAVIGGVWVWRKAKKMQNP